MMESLCTVGVSLNTHSWGTKGVVPRAVVAAANSAGGDYAMPSLKRAKKYYLTGLTWKEDGEAGADQPYLLNRDLV